MSRLAPLSLLLLALGCGDRVVTVRVSLPDLNGIETPLAGFVVSFLPYDRDSIIRTLESKAGPRPHQAEIESLFREFRKPFTSYLAASDSLTRLRSRRDSAAAAGAVVRAMDDSVTALEARARVARTELDRVRDATAPRIDSFRLAIVRWEDSTYKDYRSLTKSHRVFANPVNDTTDATGWATITLTNGNWWATARSIDPGDPNAEWYWNIRIDRDTIRLDPRTGRHRPRY